MCHTTCMEETKYVLSGKEAKMWIEGKLLHYKMAYVSAMCDGNTIHMHRREVVAVDFYKRDALRLFSNVYNRPDVVIRTMEDTRDVKITLTNVEVEGIPLAFFVVECGSLSVQITLTPIKEK